MSVSYSQHYLIFPYSWKATHSTPWMASPLLSFVSSSLRLLYPRQPPLSCKHSSCCPHLVLPLPQVFFITSHVSCDLWTLDNSSHCCRPFHILYSMEPDRTEDSNSYIVPYLLERSESTMSFQSFSKLCTLRSSLCSCSGYKTDLNLADVTNMTRCNHDSWFSWRCH